MLEKLRQWSDEMAKHRDDHIRNGKYLDSLHAYGINAEIVSMHDVLKAITQLIPRLAAPWRR